MENQHQTRINIQIYGTNAGFPAQMEEKMSGWCEEGVKWGTHGALIEIFWRWGCRNWEKMDEIQHRWMENQFKIDTLIYGWSTGERTKRWMIEGGERGRETLRFKTFWNKRRFFQRKWKKRWVAGLKELGWRDAETGGWNQWTEQWTWWHSNTRSIEMEWTEADRRVCVCVWNKMDVQMHVRVTKGLKNGHKTIDYITWHRHISR